MYFKPDYYVNVTHAFSKNLQMMGSILLLIAAMTYKYVGLC